MKRFALAFLLLTGVAFLFSQCGSADAAEKTANKFFKSIIQKDFAKAESMIDRPVGDTTNFAQQLQLLENNPTNGQLIGFKKSMGFNTNMTNGVTTVELPYMLKYESGERAFTVVVQNRGNGYKIVSVQ